MIQHACVSMLLQVLWGHARLLTQPPAPWLSQVLEAASAQLPHFTARDSAMLLWALAALGHLPGQRLVSGLLGGMFLSSVKLKAATAQVRHKQGHQLAYG